MSGDHSILAPSSASRWVQCPASVTLEGLFPDKSGAEGEEGELAHKAAAEMLRTGSADQHSLSGYTDEMMDGAEMLFDHVQKVRAEVGDHAVLHVEEKIRIPHIHPECYGTDDAALMHLGRNVLHVWDYKFGHRYVDPFENWQLLSYALGELAPYGTATTESIEIHLHIVQPRSFHPDGPIRTWTLFGSELFSKYLPVLQAAAAEAMGPRPTARVGDECRYCRARHACTTLQSAAFEAVTLSGRAHPHEWEPDAMGRELALLQSAQDLLKSRISGLEDEVLGRIKLGHPVKGWMTQQGMGREKWVKPIEEVLALGEMMGVDIAKRGAVTPKQAIKAGIPAAVVATYSETPHGEIKLMRDDTRLARKAFGA